MLNFHEIKNFDSSWSCVFWRTPKKIKKKKQNKRNLCSWVVPLLLCGPSVYVSVSQSECLESGVQSHCLGAQMHIQSCVLCSLNSVNPSAVLKTEDTSVFSVFAAKPDFHSFFFAKQVANTTSTDNHPPSPFFSLSVCSLWMLLSFTKPSWKYIYIFFLSLLFQKCCFFFFFWSQKRKCSSYTLTQRKEKKKVILKAII